MDYLLMARRILLVAFFFLVSISSATALEPFAGAVITDSASEQQQRYRLVLSQLKHIQGETFAEEERWLSGSLQRRIDELPQRASLKDVYDHYLATQQGLKILYQCQGIDCGSSTFWANDVFGYSRLVSRDREQGYLVSFEKIDGAQKLTIIYISMRGGRQPRVLVDQFTTTDAVFDNAVKREDIVEALAETSGWLPGFVVRDEQVDLSESQVLIDQLNDLSLGVKKRLYLIVHCYDGVRMQETIECSESLAADLRKSLDDTIDVRAEGALVASPTGKIEPGLRFIFWPGR